MTWARYTRVSRADAPQRQGTIQQHAETLGGGLLLEVRWDRGGSSWHAPEELAPAGGADT